MDKWLEEFGIYDFLGVMCPGIFALGIGYMFCDINHLSYISKEIVKHLGIKITGNNLQYFSYIYIIVAVYIFGSFIHEIGHMFSEIYSTGFNGISRLAKRAIKEQIPLCFYKGNSEPENTFLLYDMANSNQKERETWFLLMNNTENTMCQDQNDDKKYPYKLDFKFGKIQSNSDKVKLISAAFYQHCKRYVAYKNYGRTSKKKDAIYGLSRNVSWIFLALLIVLLIFCNLNKLDTTKVEFYIQFVVYSIFSLVFACKFVRYKNMEVIDVIRTYKCLVENKEKKANPTTNNG